MHDVRQDQIKFYWGLALPWTVGNHARLRDQFLFQTKGGARIAHEKGLHDVRHVYCFSEHTCDPEPPFSHLIQATVLTDTFEEGTSTFDDRACLLSAALEGIPVEVLPFELPDQAFLSSQITTRREYVDGLSEWTVGVKIMHNEPISSANPHILRGVRSLPLSDCDDCSSCAPTSQFCYGPDVSCKDVLRTVHREFRDWAKRGTLPLMTLNEVLIENACAMVPILNGERVDTIVARINALRENIRMIHGGATTSQAGSCCGLH